MTCNTEGESKMHMKYFQSVTEIVDHLEKVLDISMDPGDFGWMLLDSWGVAPTDLNEIREELEVCRYLVACQLMFAHGESVRKPTVEVVNRCFERHLVFLDRIHGIHAYNANKYPLPILRKRYKACRHYLFKFSLPAWYEKMPEKILSFDEKYPEMKY